MTTDQKWAFGLVCGGLAIATLVLLNNAKEASRTNIGMSEAVFSSDTANLPEAKLSETVELKNGDSYDLTASMVKKNINSADVKMLAYNGSIPGPLIKVKQGAEITINFTNNTDVETTLHSHGVRVENKFDGVPVLNQKAIPVGGTFAYKLKFPDAGMYWYHPHVREDYAQELGLYGNFLVEPTDSAYWSPVNREIPLILDDILMQNGAIVPFNKSATNHALMGRYGNVMLVNGETDFKMNAQKGEVLRLYITNTANVRPFNFAIQDAKLKLVGADGGAYQKDEWRNTVIIAPSERAIVEVLFDKSGTLAIENRTPDTTYPLGTIQVSDTPVVTSYAKEFATLKIHGEVMKSVEAMRLYFDKVPDKRIVLNVDMSASTMQSMGGHMMMGDSADGIEWDNENVNNSNSPTSQDIRWNIVDEDTGKKNMDINWVFQLGKPVKIRITNSAHSMHPMQHPIHFHGQQFLVLARNNRPEINFAWKDAVLVPAGETVDILLNPTNPGTWMAHCHIAEHLESGMMFNFTVK
ncbi:MAG: multicopper oxidase family protein [Candidatus Andersenbacteria bacterium]